MSSDCVGNRKLYIIEHVHNGSELKCWSSLVNYITNISFNHYKKN